MNSKQPRGPRKVSGENPRSTIILHDEQPCGTEMATHMRAEIITGLSYEDIRVSSGTRKSSGCPIPVDSAPSLLG